MNLAVSHCENSSVKPAISRIADGDIAAMRSFYKTHAEAVYQFALAKLADPYEAADIMQETMIEVWRNAHRFNGRSSVRTWLFVIARNKSIDHNRRAGKLVHGLEFTDTEDEAPGPMALVHQSQENARLRRLVDRLPAAQRSAVHLAFFENLSMRDIAEIEACPESTVKSRIRLAKTTLLKQWEGLEQPLS